MTELNKVAHFSTVYPPTANTMWRRHGHMTYLTKRAKEFRQIVLADFRCAIPSDFRALRHGVHLELFFSPPDRRKRDLDNVIKPMIDALTHAGCWIDDCQIDRIEATRRPIVKHGYSEVLIYETAEVPVVT